MRHLEAVFRPSLTLLTDLYQLTMAYGYWKSGAAEREGVFQLFFRRNPFEGGFAIACGLDDALQFVRDFRFEPSDLAYLQTLTGHDEKPLFEPAFLELLGGLRCAVQVDAVPEGTVVFPQEPLLRVRGPLLQCQLLETALLNMINFQTLIATKAARIRLAAQGDPVVEFGLRRAQGVDGALAATRAAYVGGCVATSNVLAGRLFGIPVRGTHAHSWVMSFESEQAAFAAYAEAMPNNCVFLVDTYDTLEGVRRAVEVGRRLRAGGHKLVGIRLDSGDLAYLSIEARKILDEAGFADAVIAASNDLDEHIIASLKRQGARIGLWGVGTRLVTGHEQAALGGVYKLTAIRAAAEEGGGWRYPIKLSEQAVKITTPGILQVRRFRGARGFLADAIYDTLAGPPAAFTIVDPLDMTRRRRIDADTVFEDLLVPVVRDGRPVYASPDIHALQRRAIEQIGQLHPGITRFENPHQYPVGLELGLHEQKTELILRARGVG